MIKNTGSGPVTSEQGFWVDVYINPTQAPVNVNEVWQKVSSQGMVWGVTAAALPLDPGESLVLTSGGDYYWPTLSHVITPITRGTAIYAQVDSAHTGTNYGGVMESHEKTGAPYNNISGPIITSADTSLAESSTHSTTGSGHNLPPRP